MLLAKWIVSAVLSLNLIRPVAHDDVKAELRLAEVKHLANGRYCYLSALVTEDMVLLKTKFFKNFFLNYD